jgi:hypothetical protein
MQHSSQYIPQEEQSYTEVLFLLIISQRCQHHCSALLSSSSPVLRLSFRQQPFLKAMRMRAAGLALQVRPRTGLALQVRPQTAVALQVRP